MSKAARPAPPPAQPLAALAGLASRGRVALLVGLALLVALSEGVGILMLAPLLAALDGGAAGGGAARLLAGLPLPRELGALLAAFVALVAGRALLIVGHRGPLADTADQLVRLEGGRIVERRARVAAA